MAGFIAKVSVFSAAVQSGYWPLVLVAVLASVAAAFFYIRVIVLMYMQEPMRELESVRIEREPAGMVAIAVPAILTVLLGILPGVLFGFLRTASVIRF
jgi:NADH-quinone oxidoreductase subunit N